MPWPKQIIFLWEFKDKGPTPNLIRTRVNLTEELPTFDQLYYTPDRARQLVSNLDYRDRQLVEAALSSASVKWVEQNDVLRGVVLYELGGLVVDADIQVGLHMGAVLEKLRHVDLLITAGNHPGQPVEPDIVAAIPKHPAILDAVRCMCTRISKRKGYSLATGPMWSICGAWVETCKKRNIVGLPIVQRYLPLKGGKWHQTVKSHAAVAVFTVRHAASWGSTRGVDGTKIKKMKCQAFTEARIPFLRSLNRLSKAKGTKRKAAALEDGTSSSSLLTPVRPLQHALDDIRVVEQAVILARTTLTLPVASAPQELIEIGIGKPIRTMNQLQAAMDANVGIRPVIARIILTNMTKEKRTELMIATRSSKNTKKLVAREIIAAKGTWTKNLVRCLTVGPNGTAGGLAKARAARATR